MSIIGSWSRSLVVAVGVVALTSAIALFAALPAGAAPSGGLVVGQERPEGPYPPVNCFPTDMEGPGPILYEYRETVREPIGDTFRDVHHYDYSFKYGERPPGSTWCFGRPELIAGELSADGQTCLYSGIAAVAGAVIPQVGVVNAVFFFTTSCGIALLVD